MPTNEVPNCCTRAIRINCRMADLYVHHDRAEPIVPDPTAPFFQLRSRAAGSEKKKTLKT